MLLQTTLGAMFRQIGATLGEEAAFQYLRRLASISKSGRQAAKLGLQKVLSDHYKLQYDVFLRYIDPLELKEIKYLSEGKNGRVLSAVWSPPRSIETQKPQKFQVVLKHILEEDTGRHNALSKFLHEVTQNYNGKLIENYRWKLSMQS